MENASSEDLSWWWRGWYVANWTYDAGVTKIAYVKDDQAQGALVTVENRDPLVLPTTVRVTLVDRTTKGILLPAETWIRDPAVAAFIGTGTPLLSATIDPGHHLPDRDCRNETLDAPRR
jgi:hypothetical protein